MPTRQLVNIQIASIIFNFLILNTENNEGFQDGSDSPYPLATPKEKYLWGLMKGRSYSHKIVDIRNVDDSSQHLLLSLLILGISCVNTGEL